MVQGFGLRPRPAFPHLLRDRDGSAGGSRPAHPALLRQPALRRSAAGRPAAAFPMKLLALDSALDAVSAAALVTAGRCRAARRRDRAWCDGACRAADGSRRRRARRGGNRGLRPRPHRGHHRAGQLHRRAHRALDRPRPRPRPRHSRGRHHHARRARRERAGGRFPAPSPPPSMPAAASSTPRASTRPALPWTRPRCSRSTWWRRGSRPVRSSPAPARP